MKILIAGATGFLGQKLSLRLATAGHEVSALVRNPDTAMRRSPHLGQCFGWTADQAPPSEAFADIDVIVNLVGEPVNGRWTAEKKRRLYESRIQSTRNLVNALSGRDAQALVNASAVGFYGNRGDEELSEGSAPGSGFLADLTADWEEAAVQAEKSGSRVALLRLGLVLANDGAALKPMLPMFRLGIGGPLGGGRQWWAWIHVEDTLAAMEKAITEPLSGAYNLSAPQPVRQADFARSLGRALHRPSALPAPSLALRLVLGQFADEILFSKRVLPTRLNDAGFKFRFPDIDSALTDLLAQKEAKSAI